MDGDLAEALVTAAQCELGGRPKGERDAFVDGILDRAGGDAAALFRRAMPVAGEREGVFVLPLGSDGKVLSEPVLVALGDGYGTTEVKLGDVFVAAYKADAKAIIVAHNHPSGDLTPSKADRNFTAALGEMCERLGNIQILDHLIIGGKGGMTFSSCLT